MRLTLRQLHYFVAVVDAANMSRAARLLHVAPTALSLQVKAMEESLGVRLLERHSRGVRPTEMGGLLYERARTILGMVEDTEREIRPGVPDAFREVRLGMPPAVARTIGVDVVLGAASGFDGLALHVKEGWSADLMEKLRADELDFVVGYGLEGSEGVEAIEILEERFVLAGTPGLIGTGRRIALSGALDFELVFYSDRGIAWLTVTEAAAMTGRSALQIRDVQAIDVWRSMLCRGVSAAITPFGAVAEECRRGELVVRQIDRPHLTRRLGLAGRSDRFAIGQRLGFVDFLADLVVRAHVELGPYYRILRGKPKDAAADGLGAELQSPKH